MPTGLTLYVTMAVTSTEKPSRPVNTRSELVPISGLPGPDQAVGDLGRSCPNLVTVYHRGTLDQTSIQVDETSLTGENRETHTSWLTLCHRSN